MKLSLKDIPPSGTPGRKKIPPGYESNYPHPTPENLSSLPYTNYIKSFLSWDDFHLKVPNISKEEWHSRMQFLLDIDYQRLAESLWDEIEDDILKTDGGETKVTNDKSATGYDPGIVYGTDSISDFENNRVQATHRGGIPVADTTDQTDSTEQSPFQGNDYTGGWVSSTGQVNTTEDTSGSQDIGDQRSGYAGSGASGEGTNVGGGYGGSSSSNNSNNSGHGITRNSEGRFSGSMDVSKFKTKLPPQRNKWGLIKFAAYAKQQLGRFFLPALELDENFKRLSLVDCSEYFTTKIDEYGTTLEPKQLLVIFKGGANPKNENSKEQTLQEHLKEVNSPEGKGLTLNYEQIASKEYERINALWRSGIALDKKMSAVGGYNPDAQSKGTTINDPNADALKKDGFYEFVVYTLADNSYRFIKVSDKDFDPSPNTPPVRDITASISDLFWSSGPIMICKTA
jgi:hypothetical protein